ncbi:hypothetical protein RCL_jg21656.t3 [Rhizophagus clarus]|uniref:Uncharacterized protein n=1 Tax=Rhizophagus clarus TaxID=94130 RepID=A0A8H3QGE5_9GLOM|nr:hypothetical protein RCL_jg21656.t3 [Rhizophagus clarus]
MLLITDHFITICNIPEKALIQLQFLPNTAIADTSHKKRTTKYYISVPGIIEWNLLQGSTKFLEVHNTISYILTFQSKWLVLLIGGNDIVEGKQRVFIVEPINNIDYPELNVKQISQHNGTIFIIKSCPFLPRFCRRPRYLIYGYISKT